MSEYNAYLAAGICLCVVLVRYSDGDGLPFDHENRIKQLRDGETPQHREVQSRPGRGMLRARTP